MSCGGSLFASGANGGPARPAAGTPTLSVYRAAHDGTWSPLGRAGALGGLLFAGLCPATPRHGLPPLHPAGIWSSLVFVRGALPLHPLALLTFGFWSSLVFVRGAFAPASPTIGNLWVAFHLTRCTSA